MPKVVDHDAYRKELAQRAIALFSRHGYSALGMRQIAAELGLSKSALYHYFPTKKDLFAASTVEITQGVADQVAAITSAVEGKSDDERMAIMEAFFEELAPQFAGEAALLLDYLRNRTPDDIAADPSMTLANERYASLFEALAGKKHGKAIYCMMLGALLQQHFDGGQTSFNDIEKTLQSILNS